MRRGRGWSCRSRAPRSFGVGLARAVAAAGLTVIECEQPNRKARRGKGKSDPIDAHLAVLAALRLDADRLPVPRADGDREALRILLGARHELAVATTAQTNRLRACCWAGEDTERDMARVTLDRSCARWPWRGDGNPVRPAASRRCGTARSGAWLLLCGRGVTRWRPTGLSCRPSWTKMAPGLTERRGIGAVTAAQAIVSFSHPGRCRSDAAFAALSGTSPLQASSGKTVRHRLNRGGDRALNSAIHTIALTRMRCCPTTKDYVARRRAEGKSSREIQRCLKRYIARELYRALNASTTLTAQTSAASGGRLTNIEASEGQYSSEVQQRPRRLTRSASSRCVRASVKRLEAATARSSGRSAE